MRQLLLLRHAKAAPAEGDSADFERPLAPQGLADAPRVAQAIALMGAAPQLALVSTATRCRQTWEAVKSAFPGVREQLVDELYNADAETLLETAETAGVERVIVVAHNPGLHDLATRFAHRNSELDAKVRAKMPPAGSALFERKDENSSWKLVAFVTPETA